MLVLPLSARPTRWAAAFRNTSDSKFPNLVSSLGTDDLKVVSHLKTSIDMALKVVVNLFTLNFCNA